MESSHPETLQLLLKDDTIRSSRVVSTSGNGVETAMKTFGLAPPMLAVPDPPSQPKDNNTNGNSSRQTDTELFTSVVGVEGGISILSPNEHCLIVDKMRSTKKTKLFTVFKSMIPKLTTLKRDALICNIPCWKNMTSGMTP